MRRSLAALTAAALVTGTIATGGVMADSTPASAADSSPSSCADQATRAYDAFVARYWDADRKYFSAQTDGAPNDGPGPENGRYSDYWWEGQLWSMVEDRYAATRDPDARAKIDEVYDGFRAAYPDFTANDYNDDIGWWAAGAIRAYEITGERRFLDAAKEFYGYIAQFEDSTYGGGIWWKNDILDGDHNQKNIATNGTAVQTALRLYRATGDRGYRDQAVRIYTWLRANFDIDGRIRDNISGDGEWKDYEFTYNQGQFAGAALQMFLLTSDRRYLADATGAADWAVRNLTVSGTFRDEGSGDGGGFKAILTRVLRLLVDRAGQRQYEAVLTLNATQAADHRNAAGIGGQDWSTTAPDAPLESLLAGGSVAIQQQARPDRNPGPVEGTRDYPAENVVTTGIPSASTRAGYGARGYLDWTAASGSSATFPVNAARTGSRTLLLRYQADSTSARTITVGNGASSVVRLPATRGRWATVPVRVRLASGFTPVVVSSTGSDGAIALDGIRLVP